MRRLLLAALLLFPLPAFGADGSAWTGVTGVDQGVYDTKPFYLADGKISSDTTSTEFDMIAKGGGWPLFFVVTVDVIDPQCTGTPTFQLTGTSKSGGPKANLGTPLSGQGSGREYVPTHQYLGLTLAGADDCDSPGNDVGILLFYPRD